MWTLYLVVCVWCQMAKRSHKINRIIIVVNLQTVCCNGIFVDVWHALARSYVIHLRKNCYGHRFVIKTNHLDVCWLPNGESIIRIAHCLFNGQSLATRGQHDAIWAKYDWLSFFFFQSIDNDDRARCLHHNHSFELNKIDADHDAAVARKLKLVASSSWPLWVALENLLHATNEPEIWMNGWSEILGCTRVWHALVNLVHLRWPVRWQFKNLLFLITRRCIVFLNGKASMLDLMLDWLLNNFYTTQCICIYDSNLKFLKSTRSDAACVRFC